MNGFRKSLGITLIAAALALMASADVQKTRTYEDGTFSDVRESEWYASDVKDAYEYALVNGAGNGLFEPDGDVTAAEALTMALNVRTALTGEAVPASSAGKNWYDAGVAFATEKGIVAEGAVDDYDRPATRAEVAGFFAKALPKEHYNAVNSVTDIPDVPADAPYREALLLLYRAGVIMGNDAYGTFRPNANITRAEATAILNRAARPEKRLKKSLDVLPQDDAYIVVNASNFTGNKEGIHSGWALDNRGGTARTELGGNYGTLNDVSRTEGTAMIRELNKAETGRFILQMNLSLSDRYDGAYIEFRNDKDAPVYRLDFKDNAVVYRLPDGGEKVIREIGAERAFVLYAVLDLDNRRTTTYINREDCGTYPFAVPADALNLQNFRYATTEESTAAVTCTQICLRANYALYDEFFFEDGTQIPFGWTGRECTAGSTLVIRKNGEAHKTFAPVSGNVVFETDFLFGTNQTGEIALMSGGEKPVLFTAKDNALFVNGTEVYRDYVPDLWYILRFEADTETQTVTVRLNGRTLAELPFAAYASSFDAVHFTNTFARTSSYDNIHVFRVLPHDDYVPAPVKPKGEEAYNVGINVCSLWDNDNHFGWACVTPFDDIIPVLGYYDEGNPETADWEIKYLAEHGVDFQAFCAYFNDDDGPQSLSVTPHLFRGYQNARYRDSMKYCLIWECANAARPKNMYAWKQYFVPYFIEHYFKDPNYMTLDNKLLLYVFGATKLAAADSFGSAAEVKEAFDYLEEEVKKLGFDGVIFAASNNPADSTLASMGFDAAYAYNYGSAGYQVEVNKNGNRNYAASSACFGIPTASVGFNNVAWAGTRHPLITVADLKEVLLWMRDEFSPSYAKKGTWQENFFMLSTWNEYGEGTYFMPVEGEKGFGYLDAVREVFTSEKADPSLNTVPTAAQKARINHLYPQHQRLLRKEGNVTYETVIRYGVCRPYFTVNVPGEVSSVSRTDDYVVYPDGSVSGTSNHADSILTFNNGHSLDLSETTVVKIRAKLPKGEHMQFFFTTVESRTWEEAKSFSLLSTSDEMTDYYFDFSGNEKWKGTLLWFRFDPTGNVGVSWKLESMTFMTPPEIPKSKKRLSVNSVEFEMQLEPEYAETGDYLVAFDPAIALDYKLNAYHTWNKATGTLTLMLNGHTVVYTVGSDRYMLDGREKSLGFTLHTTDGLPMIPLEKLCDDVGYEYIQLFDGSLDVLTNENEYFRTIASRHPYDWEFNVPGDTENWRSYFMSLNVRDGYMHCESLSDSTDPTIIRVNRITPMISSDYTGLQYRVRYDFDSLSQDTLTMYFITEEDPVWSESKTVKIPLDGNTSAGEFLEFETTITNPLWKGLITDLRFDPFNAVGEIDVDYIRFTQGVCVEMM